MTHILIFAKKEKQIIIIDQGHSQGKHTLKKNASAYEKSEYEYLANWYIKATTYLWEVWKIKLNFKKHENPDLCASSIL